MDTVIAPVFGSEPIKPDARTKIFINPDGPIIGGGPASHSGLTGRKNAVDTYGEYCRHSQKALSGKDPTRIDRSGVYAARYAAKNVVAAGLARECEIQLSYSIGLPGPLSLQVETFGSGAFPEARIAELLKRHFDFRLAGILKNFELRLLPARYPKGFYQKLAAYGQVGRTDLDLPWEKTDRAAILAEDAGRP
jgi:S-adenosylmethionine synthetase